MSNICVMYLSILNMVQSLQIQAECVHTYVKYSVIPEGFVFGSSFHSLVLFTHIIYICVCVCVCVFSGKIKIW